MNTQGTKVHIGLWNRSFWMLIVSNLLLCISVTMLIPALPLWLRTTVHLNHQEVGMVMAAFAIGLFLPGPFCSFLVQRYRRNAIFIWSVIALALTMILPILQFMPKDALWIILVWRVVQGASFGLAQMVLSSTLIIDTCESHQRTEANHSATWFGRFALSLGPLLALLIMQFSAQFSFVIPPSSLWTLNVFFISAVCCVLSALLVLCVHFPFRVPADNLHVMSCDRFLLTSAWPLFINLLLVSTGIGLLFSIPVSVHAYGMVMVGFLLAVLAERFVFCNAELRSEAVTGFIMISAALLILLSARLSPLTTPLIGLGLGLVGGRFLLFFVKLSRHCQRGTSQSTFMLGWESGLAIGIGIGYYVFDSHIHRVLSASLAVIIVAFLLYVVWVHHWYETHKNR